MKRPLIRREVIGFGIIAGIVLGMWIHLLLEEQTVIVYEAKAYTIDEEPKEVLIETKIDWTDERIEKEIRATFPEDPDVAVAIAKAESHLVATAVNPERHKDRKGNTICRGSIGIMQIACVHHTEDVEGLKDIKLNLAIARKIYDKSGWSRWGAYTNGSYKKYL